MGKVESNWLIAGRPEAVVSTLSIAGTVEHSCELVEAKVANN